MPPAEFDSAIKMLRSTDSMTYENGYQWLRCPNLTRYVHQIVKLLQSEADPQMRAKFVEIVGNADRAEYIPILVEHLSHDCSDVRFWAYSGLLLSEHKEANTHAAHHHQTHPDEDFY